jgi:hypothetical protein
VGNWNVAENKLDVPAALFKRPQLVAPEHGISLWEFVSEAFAEKLIDQAAEDKPWMKQFGELRYLHKETERISRIIRKKFEIIEPEDWS